MDVPIINLAQVVLAAPDALPQRATNETLTVNRNFRTGCPRIRHVHKMDTIMNAALKNLRTFLSDYCHFADPNIVKPLSYWIAATYIFEAFDCFPYMSITARVKRAGKTRLSELIGFTCSMPFNVAGASAASLFRTVEENKPTIIIDEAESLSSESASTIRTFLNVGYRKGQTIPRADGKRGVEQWPTYCPKVFVLIGDVYDTLRDRSIIVEMQRGEPEKRFSYEIAKLEGAAIADEIKSLIAERLEAIQGAYEETSIPFLTDRDAEIWRPIFSVAKAIEPESITELSRIAVDLATEKTAERRQYGFVNQEEAEKTIRREEYARRAVADLLVVTDEKFTPANGKKGQYGEAIPAAEAVAVLKNIDIAPWRKYEGTGLEGRMLADLVAVLELRSKPIRASGPFKGAKQNVFRGFTRKDILACAKKYNIKSSVTQ